MDSALIKIEQAKIGGDEMQTVSARELHAFLEVGRDFTNWIDDRIREYEFLPNRNYAIIAKSGGNSKRGRKQMDYILSLEMAKELAMVERNERGRQIRRYFIEAENRLRQMSGASWIDARNQGKAIRRLTTDIIKVFIDYAKGQGSENAEMYYMNFTKMVNGSLLDIEGKKPTNMRDQLNVLQLHQLSVAEGIVTKSLIECIGRQLHYKEIYKIAKEKIAVYSSATGRSKLGSSEKQTVGLLGVS